MIGGHQQSHRAEHCSRHSKRIDEFVHIIKFDLNYEVKEMTIEDRFRQRVL